MTLKHFRLGYLHQHQADDDWREAGNRLHQNHCIHRPEQQHAGSDAGEARCRGLHGNQPAQGFARAGAAGEFVLVQVDFSVVQQRQVRPGNQAESDAEQDLIEQKVDK